MEGTGANGFGGDWREGDEERVSQGMEVSGSGRRDEDESLIGAYVGKDGLGVGRVLLGKVISYDETRRVYRVIYEDGHQEDMEQELVGNILRIDDGAGRLTQRKRRLERIIPTGALNRRNTRSRNKTADVPASLGLTSTEVVSVDADSSSDSCDHARIPAAAANSCSVETHVLPLELPPSSGDIAVPEGSISYLFSTYTFLRSFSLQLFLSPFGFDDYVGSLNCSVQNSLMDSIHLALMRALSRHLQMLSCEGSNLASRCLKFYDWTLLDLLTWPAFLAEYFFVMGYLKELETKEFIDSILNGEYYCLTVATKLKVLQLLCDDVINSGELRTELGMRIGMEEDNEEVLDAYLPKLDVPIGLYNEISKTSHCRDRIISRESVVLENEHVNPLVSEPDADASANSLDKNSDECCLCGMDGTLICCDGCPSAYHSRCIGLNKAFLPEGLWFCPECCANKIGPTFSKIGKGASGAEVLGTDPHGRFFVGTCNYLLILDTSLNEEPVSRYYNQDDIPKVLSVLSSTQENALTYFDISTGISEYFEIPMISFGVENSDPMWDVLASKDGAACYFANTPSRIAVNILNNSGDSSVNNIMTCNSEHNVAKVDGIEDPASPSVLNQAGIINAQTIFKENHDVCAKKVPVIADEISIPLNNGNPICGIMDPKIFLSKQIETSVNQGFGSVVTNLSCSNPAMPAQKSSFVNNFSLSSGNGSEICKEEADSSIYSIKNGSAGACFESRHFLNRGDVAQKNTNDRGSTVPISFKTLTYINQYIQGDIAASAAASLAVLSTKDRKFTSAHGSSNPKKIVTATIALQIKAFSVAVMNFLWPCAEKKLTDVPRERCGWCIACKGPTTNKRGCLLNLAASNAIKGPARNCNLRANKHHESYLPVIAAQLLIMEESLRGLLIGEFLDEHNNQWRKQVREANSCSNLKSLVLQLEKNIRGIVFTGGWTRMIDDIIENHKSSNGNSRTGGNQKRGNVGRRSKKQSELILVSSDDKCNDLQWWRGGKLSRAILQSGTIPSSLAKKAARKGGRERISGISYHESSAYHRRSRQFAWRAAVEMCKSTSQLALQVRYLDVHIRWKEFSCSEHVPLDIKGSETDVMVFRNAFICDKRIVGNNVLYALNFGDQKHLPLRITKTVLQSEKTQDGNEKLWFSEDHIPLNLIKEYEEKVGTSQVLPAVSMVQDMSKFKRRQLEFYWGDIFTYLVFKRENPGECPFCQKGVCLRSAVKCKSCEDYCHLYCSVPSLDKQSDDPMFSRMCKLCYSVGSSTPLESSHRDCSGKPFLSGNNQLLSVPGMSSISQTEDSGSRSSNPTLSESKTKRSGGKWVTNGIVWRRKKHGSEAGKEFMMENIVFKAKEGQYSSKRPICCLCKMPYNSNLMYVCCETCNNWCHADAVLLDETKIHDVVGFKCCRCRRKSSPTCPYSKVGYVKLDETLKHDDAVDIGDDMQIHPKSESSTSSLSNSESENFDMVESDPLLHSFVKVEPVYEAASEIENKFGASMQSSDGQQKLSVRRSQFNQKDFDEWYAKHIGEYEASPERLQNILASSTMDASWKMPSNSETENFAMVEFDPLLHSFSRVEPVDGTAFEMEDKFYASIQSSDGLQKLSVRRSHDNAVEIVDDMQIQPKSGSSTTSISNSETENFGMVEYDTSLHSYVKVKPVNEVAPKMEDKFDASILSSDGKQKPFVRRSQVNQNDFDEWYAMQIGNPSYDATSENLQNILEPIPRNSSWKMPSFELDSTNTDGPDNTDFDNVYEEDHSSDQEVDMAGDMAFEPQTYFSFTQLLAPVDDVPMDTAEHQDVPITLNDYGVIYSDMPCHNLNNENDLIVKEEVTFDGLECQKCKLCNPSPDLICDICSLCIHSHCSPWVEESIEDSTGSKWRCGNCRDWR